MDHSTEGVTVFSGYVTDLLEHYQDIATTTGKELFAMASGLDLSNPTNKVPMSVFNAMCQWIVDNLGPANIRQTGMLIGTRLYQHMLENKIVNTDSTPLDILKAFQKASLQTVQDPRGRGWAIIDHDDKFCCLRKTQTYHPILQEGLIKSLIQQVSGIEIVRVQYLKSIAAGDEFDEYKVSWS